MSAAPFSFPPPPPPPPPSSASPAALHFPNRNLQQHYASRPWEGSRGSYDSRANRSSGPHGAQSYRGGQSWASRGPNPRFNGHYQDRGQPSASRGTDRPGSRYDCGGVGRGQFGSRGKNYAPQRSITVAPAVPSFGGPLPTLSDTRKTIVASDEPRAHKKRKRDHNQLGLTPSGEAQNASDDDVDEEARLAASHNASGSGLNSLPHHGELSSLKSPAEIAAWIAERKKRYPTIARIEQNKKREHEMHELRQAALKAQNEARDKQKDQGRIERQGTSKLQDKGARVESLGGKKSAEMSKVKGTLGERQEKIERLEKRLAKEKLKIQSHKVEGGLSAPASGLREALSPDTKEKSVRNLNDEVADNKTSSVSSDESTTTDTDSDGSTSTSEYSSSSEAPETISKKRLNPQKVPPPKRPVSKVPLCHNIARFGKCIKTGCRFRHDNPAHQSQPMEKRADLNLYQKLVQQEKDEEDKVVLAAIMYLGDHGRLDEREG